MRRADANLTSHAEVHIGEFFGAHFPQLGNLAFGRHEAFARCGEPQGLHRAVDQFKSGFRFQTQHELRERRLRNVQHFCSLGKTPLGEEYGEVMVGIVCHAFRRVRN